MGLEQLVRPFQRTAPFVRTSVYVQTTQVSSQDGSLTWGQSGDVPNASQQVEPDAGTGINFKLDNCVTGYIELGRESEDVRVENPDDSTQFVMVQRVKKMSFAKAADTNAGDNFNLAGQKVAQAFASFSNSVEGALARFTPQTQCKTDYQFRPPRTT